MASTFKDQVIELIERVIDPNKGNSQKAICDAFVKLCDDSLIDSVPILFGYVDQAKPDEEWWKIIQSVTGLGPDNRLAWSKVKEVWRASKLLLEEKKDTVLTKEELEDIGAPPPVTRKQKQASKGLSVLSLDVSMSSKSSDWE